MKLINRTNSRSIVLTIFPDGSKRSLPLCDAFYEAQDLNLDLVEVSATPPVYKVLNFGKSKYDENKKAKQQASRATATVTKELKFTPNTDTHDLQFKVNQGIEFLQKGYKVRLSVKFKGREIVHPELGQQLLQGLFQQLSHVGTLEQVPISEGKTLSMLVGPKPSAKKAKDDKPKDEKADGARS